ncbi:MAG: sugar phosphate isomerase/epimerase [Actinomycetota bacterium]|nr:sugar phosphate isomerase/epimerase [Actinomycetota bacterium]
MAPDIRENRGGYSIVEFTLSTASLYSFELSDVFPLASETGFDGLELMVTNKEDTQSIDHLSPLIDRYDLPVRSIHAPFLMAARKVWGDFRHKIEKSVSMAKALSADLVVVHLPYFWQLSYARWAHHNLNAYNRNSDIIVAIENAMQVKLMRPMNLSFFNSLRELRHFEHLVFDTSHFAIAGVDIIHAWDELKDKVSHIHLSNNYLKGFDDHALPFEGHLPLDRFLGHLRRDGYHGSVVLELGPGPLEARLGIDRIADNLSRSLSYCREHYGSAPS